MIHDSQFDVVTIGSTTRDIFLEGAFPVRNDPESPTGKSFAAHLGSKLEVDKLSVTLGGNSANAATTFARQGLRTGCFAEVGDDLAAEEIRKWLGADGATPLFRTDAKKQTALSAVFLSPDGERTIFAYHGANADWESPPPVQDLAAPWWYLSLSGTSARHTYLLLDYAAAHHISVAFNPSGYHIRNYRRDILARLKDVSFLTLNQEEAALLLEMDFTDEAAVFKKLDELVSPGIVAISYGPKGAAVSNGRHIIRAGIYPERALVDRTGAGDAFGSGFTAGLIEKSKGKYQKSESLTVEDLQYALRLGSANATSVVECLGATPGILTQAQFESDPRWNDLEMRVEELRDR